MARDSKVSRRSFLPSLAAQRISSFQAHIWIPDLCELLDAQSKPFLSLLIKLGGDQTYPSLFVGKRTGSQGN